jgi:hypothetical protein
MPKNKDAASKADADSPKKHKPPHATYESTAFLRGLFRELHEQIGRYTALTGELLGMEARIELAEKTVCLTRDHFKMKIAKTQDALPTDWGKALESVRFVGVRLADACAKSLQAHTRMTPEELLRDLNDGMFRFRTNSPLREIHAALLRHPHVKRSGGAYVWTAPPTEKQLPMRLRVVQREMIPTGAKEEDTSKSGVGS